MKNFNIGMMKQGFFVGNFEPVAYRSENVELSIKEITTGTLDTGYYRKNDIEIVVVLMGKIESHEHTFCEGDIIVFEKGEMIEIFAVTDAKVLIAKFPGTKGDIHRREWENYEEFDKFFSRYLKKLIETTKSDEDLFIKQRIPNKDITVVIQGAVSYQTKFLIESIRKYLSGSRILISTWDYCDVNGLDYDEIVFNKDPGTLPCEIWDNFTRPNNGNRQIISTRNGIAKVKTKYTLKLRSDLVLLGDGFIDYFQAQYNRDEKYCLFEKKIVIAELYSRHSFVYHKNGKKYKVPKPFHPSDWYAFGLTSDLKTMYENVDIIPDEELQYDNLVHPDYVKRFDYKYSWRYTTEQHIFLKSVLKKYPSIHFEDWTDWDDEIIQFSDNIMKNNFVFLDSPRSNILNTNYITACFANNELFHPEEMLYTFSETRGTFERTANDN